MFPMYDIESIFRELERNKKNDKEVENANKDEK